MSVGSKSLPARRGKDEGHENGEDGAAVAREEGGDMVITGSGGASGSRSRSRKQKSARFDRCFSGLELSIGPGPLKDVDAGRLKGQIKKWAKAVVAFARQISFVGSPRSAAVPTTPGSGDDTPRSAPLRASRSSSRLGARGAKEGEGASDVSA